MIEEANHSHGEFLSNVFLRPKKDLSFRMILKLRNLNLHDGYSVVHVEISNSWLLNDDN